jgi:hypothetical protein
MKRAIAAVVGKKEARMLVPCYRIDGESPDDYGKRLTTDNPAANCRTARRVQM